MDIKNLFIIYRSSLQDTITQHLYGVTKKDHINYALISSIECLSEITNDTDTNRLSEEQRHIILPSFKGMISYVSEMAQKRNLSGQKFVYGQITVPYSYEVYQEV